MATIKTSELSGKALDYAVALCEGTGYIGGASQEMREHRLKMGVRPPDYSSNWVQGGPIAEREKICILDANGAWAGRKTYWDNSKDSLIFYGKTPLVAAMRCFVASKMGDSVEIPEEPIESAYGDVNGCEGE
jgi:hypothetical protein